MQYVPLCTAGFAGWSRLPCPATGTQRSKVASPSRNQRWATLFAMLSHASPASQTRSTTTAAVGTILLRELSRGPFDDAFSGTVDAE